MAIEIIELEIADKKNEGPDAVSVFFKNKFDYKPGQFITLITEVEGKEERRCYSLFTTPQDDIPGIMVKKVDGGKVSGWIVNDVKPGDKYKGMPPMGSFTLNAVTNPSRIFMLAGGSGITPVISMLKSRLNDNPEAHIELYYVNRNQELAIFYDELKALAEHHPNLKIMHHFTAEKGRPDAAAIKNAFSEAARDTEFYICGPDGLMQMAQMAAVDMGIPGANIRKESFTAGITSPAEVVTPDDEKSDVTIILDGEEYKIKVAREESILFTALDNGLDMPYSCQSGVCTACRCKLIKGEVDMETSDGLTQDEIDEGYRLICVGHPGQKEIILEVD